MYPAELFLCTTCSGMLSEHRALRRTFQLGGWAAGLCCYRQCVAVPLVGTAAVIIRGLEFVLFGLCRHALSHLVSCFEEKPDLWKTFPGSDKLF